MNPQEPRKNFRGYIPLKDVPQSVQNRLELTHSVTRPGMVLNTPKLQKAMEAHNEKLKNKVKPVTVLLDFRTFAYPIYANFLNWAFKIEEAGKTAPITTAQALHYLWTHVITDLPEEILTLARQVQDVPVGQEQFRFIVCEDYPHPHPDYTGSHFDDPTLKPAKKPIYWRHLICPDYKGGRKPKPDLWDELTTSGYRVMAQLGFPICKEHYMEADDIIAQFVRQRDAQKSSAMVIWTVDTDLLQLVDDVPPVPVVWYNKPYQPYYRDKSVAKSYWLKRWKTPIDHPRDIAAFKAEFGDSSDNLPPGSPIGVIDLLNPMEYPKMDFSAALDYPTTTTAQLAEINRAVKVKCLLNNLSIK